METIKTATQSSLFAEQGSRDYKQIIRAMLIAGISTFAQLYFLQPMLPVLSRYFNITPAHSSLVISAATLGLACGLFLGTFISDKFKRKSLMSAAMIISSVLTIAAAFVDHFPVLVLLSICKGIALSGVAAIAMAYIGEEVAPAALSRTMSRYIVGTIVGGMTGRVVANFLAAWFSWQTISCIIGCACLLLSFEFLRRLPASRHFKPRKQSRKALIAGLLKSVQDKVLLSLCIFAGLAMGAFVSVYNYLGFRLEAVPFQLPHQVIACIFVMYAAGIGGSLVAVPLIKRLGAYRALNILSGMSLLGLLFTWPDKLVFVILGLCLFTVGFFGAHTIASSGAGARTPHNRAVAASLYLLFYYIGSSLLGSFSGVAMHSYGWNGIVVLLGVVLTVALLLTLMLKRRSV
ncbi:MFS transporter [Deminuibacter soli]|nr:MFS transporter [Deminuibacter soli]